MNAVLLSKNLLSWKYTVNKWDMRRTINISLLLKVLVLAVSVLGVSVLGVSAFASGPQPELTSTPMTQAKTLLEKIVGANTTIAVKLVEEVTWRSGAMGCPKPDGIYSQALIPGYRIILLADGREYAYHGRNNGEPFYCDSFVVAK